jgi:ubiquinone/menaquinone biosynthesis C-methylase UbiE/uncharacterized membrane protein YkvA (DUF1232 family)
MGADMEPFPRDQALALVRRLPAYGLLAWRLGRDPALPMSRRGALIGAAAYLASPIDAVPGIIPLLGQLDDLAVLVVALRFALAGMSPQQRQVHLASVGLTESMIAADERALRAIGAWTIRSVADVGARVSRAGLNTGSRAAQRLAALGRDPAHAIGHATRRRRSALSHAIGHHRPMTSRFDDKAREWDTPERVERAREAATAIRDHVTLERSMRVIDLGSGTGLLGLALAADVASVTLAEPSAGMLEVTREKLVAGGPANVTAIAFDLPGAPPAGAPFDLAVSVLVLHHVEDTEAALRSVRDLLRPGGQIALLDLDAEDGSFHSEEAEGIHHHGFDQAELLQTAARAGFDRLGIRPVMHIDQDGRSYPLFLLTGRRS